MTDIWRSFIATRLMHLCGYDLVFTGVSAYQDRNIHNLLRDFADEVPGYLGNDDIVNALESFELLEGIENIGKNLENVYSSLIKLGYFRVEELTALKSWLRDCDNLR